MTTQRFKSVRAPLTPEYRRRLRDGRAWVEEHKAELSRRALDRKAELLVLERVVAALRHARHERGLSLATVAKRSGIDRSQLSRLENDPHPNPTLATLTRLARAIGVELTIDIRTAA